MIFALCLPIPLVFNENRTYDINDYEQETGYDYDYEDSIFYSPPYYCEMEFQDLTDGAIIISFYQDGFSTRIHNLLLELKDENNDVIWSYDGYPPSSFGVLDKVRKSIEVDHGDYTLTAECENMGVLDLKVRFINNTSFFTTPLCCCGTPSIMLLSLVTILFSFTKERKVKKGKKRNHL